MVTEKLQFANWALLVQGSEVKWMFGDLDEESQLLTIGFLRGLHNIGKELFDRGIASLLLSPSQKSMVGSVWGDELFVVNLQGEFFLIIFDPLPTIKMLARETIPQMVDDLIRSVLSAQAAEQYANFWSSVDEEEEGILVDSLFQQALDEVTTLEEREKYNMYVEDGSCSFSGLSSVQFLVFHYVLRRLFELEYTGLIGQPWTIIQHRSAIPVCLEYKSPKKAHLLSGYLTVINDYIESLFNTSLRSLVFGGSTEIASIDLVHGSEYFMSLSNTRILFRRPEFLAKFERLEKEVLVDMKPGLVEYLARTLSDIHQTVFRQKSLDVLVYKMGDPELN